VHRASIKEKSLSELELGKAKSSLNNVLSDASVRMEASITGEKVYGADECPVEKTPVTECPNAEEICKLSRGDCPEATHDYEECRQSPAGDCVFLIRLYRSYPDHSCFTCFV